MNCRVDFIDWLTGDIAHTVTETTGLVDFSFSAKKMASVSYFAMEPQRLKITFLCDDWLETALLQPGQTLDKGISKYKVRFYIDDYVRFTGLFQMANVSHSEDNDEIEITSYDFLKLFSICPDMAMVYDSYAQSITTHYNWFIQALTSKFQVPFGSFIDYPVVDQTPIYYEELSLFSIGSEAIKPEVDQLDAEVSGSSSHTRIYTGFRSYDGRLYFYVLIARPKDYGTGLDLSSGTHGVRFKSMVWKVCNRLCFDRDSSYEIDVFIDEQGNNGVEAFNSVVDRFRSQYFFYDEEFTNSSISMYGLTYSQHIIGGIPAGSPYVVELSCSGQLVLPEYYELGSPGEAINQLDVLKTALIIANAMIWCDEEGNFRLCSKVRQNNTVSVDIKHVHSRKTSHIFPETIKIDNLSVLRGDTSALAQVLSDLHEEKISQTLEGDMEIVGDYDITLFDKLVIGNDTLKVIEVTPIPQKNEHKVKAWRIYD